MSNLRPGTDSSGNWFDPASGMWRPPDQHPDQDSGEPRTAANRSPGSAQPMGSFRPAARNQPREGATSNESPARRPARSRKGGQSE